jgi:hypothetical protein
MWDDFSVMHGWRISRACIAVSCFALMSGCSGGSGTGVDTVTLWESPARNGSGVVRATTADFSAVALVENVDSNRLVRIVDIIDVISEVDNYDGSYTAECFVRYSDGSTGYIVGIFYEQAALYGTERNGTLTVFAGGQPANNLPIGSYRYTGHAESVYYYGGYEYTETGTFAMNVQFSDGTAQLNAVTPESRYANNNLRISSAGYISGNNGTFIVYAEDGVTELDRRQIEFNGTFHGSGASHVSGIAVGGSTTDDLSFVGVVGRR